MQTPAFGKPQVGGVAANFNNDGTDRWGSCGRFSRPEGIKGGAGANDQQFKAIPAKTGIMRTRIVKNGRDIAPARHPDIPALTPGGGVGNPDQWRAKARLVLAQPGKNHQCESAGRTPVSGFLAANLAKSGQRKTTAHGRVERPDPERYAITGLHSRARLNDSKASDSRIGRR